MIKSIYYVSLLLWFNPCFAQQYTPPPINAIDLVTNQGIQYVFPEIVGKVLDEVIQKDIHSNYLLILNSESDSVFNLSLNKWFEDVKDTSNSQLIARLSNRFFKSSISNVPILLDTDYTFSTPGFVFTGSVFWIKFKYKNGNAFIIQKESEQE